jgi:hypothetical protein
MIHRTRRDVPVGCQPRRRERATRCTRGHVKSGNRALNRDGVCLRICAARAGEQRKDEQAADNLGLTHCEDLSQLYGCGRFVASFSTTVLDVLFPR